jgi:hypothetical protein
MDLYSNQTAGERKVVAALKSAEGHELPNDPALFGLKTHKSLNTLVAKGLAEWVWEGNWAARIRLV